MPKRKTHAGSKNAQTRLASREGQMPKRKRHAGSKNAQTKLASKEGHMPKRKRYVGSKNAQTKEACRRKIVQSKDAKRRLFALESKEAT